MEINNHIKDGYIQVWLSNIEQQQYDRKLLTDTIIEQYNIKPKKCRIVFMLSGTDNLYQCTENLITSNVRRI